MRAASSRPGRTRSSATSISFRPTWTLLRRTIENVYLDIVRAVKLAVHIPVAVKLSPFFSNMANMAKRLDAAGADGLVLVQPLLSAGYRSGKPGNPAQCSAEHAAGSAPAADLDRNSVRPDQGQPGRDQRHPLRRRCGQDADGRRQRHHDVFRSCCARARNTSALSSVNWNNGWPTTNTSLSARCKAA